MKNIITINKPLSNDSKLLKWGYKGFVGDEIVDKAYIFFKYTYDHISFYFWTRTYIRYVLL